MVKIPGTSTRPPDATPRGIRGFTAAEIEGALHVQQRAFLRDGPPSLALRRNRMDRLNALVFENAASFAETLCADFGTRSRQSTVFFDIAGPLSDFAYIRRNPGRWENENRTGYCPACGPAPHGAGPPLGCRRDRCAVEHPGEPLGHAGHRSASGRKSGDAQGSRGNSTDLLIAGRSCRTILFT